MHAVNILVHLSEYADSAALLLDADLTIKYLCEQHDFFDMVCTPIFVDYDRAHTRKIMCN